MHASISIFHEFVHSSFFSVSDQLKVCSQLKIPPRCSFTHRNELWASLARGSFTTKNTASGNTNIWILQPHQNLTNSTTQKTGSKLSCHNLFVFVSPNTVYSLKIPDGKFAWKFAPQSANDVSEFSVDCNSSRREETIFDSSMLS